MRENETIHLARPQNLAYLPDVERAAARIFHDYLAELQFPEELLDRPVPMAKLQQAQQENLLWVASDRNDIPNIPH